MRERHDLSEPPGHLSASSQCTCPLVRYRNHSSFKLAPYTGDLVGPTRKSFSRLNIQFSAVILH